MTLPGPTRADGAPAGPPEVLEPAGGPGGGATAGASGTWRRVIVALTLVLAAAVVVAIVLLTRGSPATPTRAGTASSASAGAVTVQRRNLVATDTESGTLSYAGSYVVYNRLSGTITWLPAVGQLIDPGYVLYRVDNQPVLLLQGSTPAYRDLDSSDGPGPDILELNAELVQLGDDPYGIVVDDEWQWATTAGVDALQARWGETETGKLALGQVVFLPGPQLISAVEATVGSTGGGGAATSLEVPASRPVFVDLTQTVPTTSTTTTTPGTTSTPAAGPTTSTTTAPTTTTTTPTTTTTTTPTTTATTTPTGATTTPATHQPKKKRKKKSAPSGPSTEQQIQALLALLKAETTELARQRSAPQSSPATTTPSSSTPPKTSTTPSKASTTPASTSSSPPKSSSSNPGNATQTAGATPILQTTSDRLIVTVDLAATSQGEAKVGGAVSVELPSGATVEGRIIAVSSVAQSSNSSGAGGGGGGSSSSSPTVPVTIALTRHISGAGLDDASVSVSFTQARARHVLSVPVTALLATGGDSYALQEAVPPHRLIPVTTGLFAAGYVQVSGVGIHAGLPVTDSQG